MSDPLLDKMDALLKKHQSAAEAASPVAATAPTATESNVPPPLPEDAWLPVLTDVVAVGSAEGPADPMNAIVPEPLPTVSEPAVDPDALIAQIMGELEPRLSSLLRDRLLTEIRNSLDDSLSALLAQMDVHIREIVREAVAEQLGKS